MKDLSYVGNENGECPACLGRLILPRPDDASKKLDFGEPRFVSCFDFITGERPNWFLTLIFHSTRDQTLVPRMHIRTGGAENYVYRYGRDVKAKPSLLIASANAETHTGHLPEHSCLGRILGVIPTMDTPLDQLVPEIRTNHYLVFGGKLPVYDGFIVPLPLAHIIRSFVKHE